MKTTSRARLQGVVGRHKAAREELESALNVAYPEGSRIVFMRSSRQTNPSFGTVIGGRVDNHPYVIVRGDSGKRKAAWISLDNIITSPNSIASTPSNNRMLLPEPESTK